MTATHVETGESSVPTHGVAVTDGFSSRGGLGTELGGARRPMDEFELTS